MSGPSVSITKQNTANVELTNLRSGTYVFRFEATDSKGNKGSDDVKVVASNNARTASSDIKAGSTTDLASAAFQVNAYPNEVRDVLHVAISSEQEESLTIQLIDVSGRILHERTSAVAPGTRETSLNIRRHVTTPGLFYLVVTRPSGEKSTHRLLRK